MGLKTLDLSCDDKLEGAIGMGSHPNGVADVIHDLEVTPWPFESDTFDYVRANDVLEHVDRFVLVMEEIHRVARDRARVEIRMPFLSNVREASNPTHRRFGTSCTFDYFDSSKPLGRCLNTRARLEVVSVKYQRAHVDNRVGRWLCRLDRRVLWLADAYPETYEAYFTGIYPMHHVLYSLRVHKGR